MEIGKPRIVERTAQPYAAVRRQVVMPFGGAIDEAMGKLFGGLEARGIQPAGAVFFKYDVVRMPELEIEFGVELAAPLHNPGDLVGGMLPAGRYAELTYFGHYDHLIDANAALIDWARAEGLAFDMEARADGDHFASRVEFYLNSPEEEPDPDWWQTVVAIKLRD
ncbi:MAG: GyrI-like domain-containing protein [Devosia sp.]